MEYLSKIVLPTPKKYVNIKGLPKKMLCMRFDTLCTIFAFENRSCLGEFEADFKKALARESRTQGVLFDEKNRMSLLNTDKRIKNMVSFNVCFVMQIKMNKFYLCDNDNHLWPLSRQTAWM
jgi:hypothetical protein